jgi:hypothetical protein
VTHVFTYGSLMFERVWSRVVSGTYRKAAGSLVGFTRQRVIGQDYPALRHVGDGDRVDAADGIDGPGILEGVVYLDVRPDDLAALDAFEGPEYRRIQVPVTLLGQARGGLPDAVVTADTYLFIASDRLEAGPWDPRRFEQEQIERFLRDYPPPRSA